MSSVEGLQQVRRLTASNLSHHDMIRSMPQGMAHEIADRDRAFLQPSRLKPDTIRVVNAKLQRVLD